MEVICPNCGLLLDEHNDFLEGFEECYECGCVFTLDYYLVWRKSQSEQKNDKEEKEQSI